MTKDEIIDLAIHSGAMFDHMTWVERDLFPVFERFAKLVAEKEREECIKIVMQGTGEPIQRKTLDILHEERTRIALAIKEQE